RQHRRLLLMLEEAGINLHVLKGAYRPCPHCGVVVSFDMPFETYLFIYLTGCCLSLLAFCVELTYERYTRLFRQGPPSVYSHSA
ncbi:hypothetical protein MTO96_038742, partial [Rhipicephalus appendiculatus]